VVIGPVVDGTRTARIAVTHDGTTAHLDLGQALRGHRFAHQTAATDAATVGNTRTAELWTALRAPGLLWTQDGDVTLEATGQDNLVALALLGRLYPDNVVLRPAGHHAGPAAAGTNGPGRLIVDLPDHDVTERQDSPLETQ
jgi:hypothetical protein